MHCHLDAEMCFLPTCRYHSFLLENVVELLKKLDPFCFRYQHVDCLFTLFKYQFIGDIVVKSGQVINNVQRAVYFNQRKRRLVRMPIIAKNRLLKKKYRKHLMSSFQQTKSGQTRGSVLAEKFKTVEKTKLELEKILIVDCFFMVLVVIVAV